MELIKRNERQVPDAWKDLRNLQREINALFQDDFFPASVGLFDRIDSPAIDVVEEEGHYLVSCEMPGISESDIDVQLADNVLTIKGTKEEKEKDSNKSWFKKETWYGNFQRTLPLPTGIESGKIEAVLENGMLMLTLPKKEEVKPKQISVKVK